MSPRYRIVKSYRRHGEPPEWQVVTEENETPDAWVVLDTFPQRWQAQRYVENITARQKALKEAE